MNSVVFDGVEYVKASEVAKRFKYTSDYVGQLCRAKKVDARLVGRTWFVNPESLTEHKQTKRNKTTVKSLPRSSESAIKIKTELTKVESPLKNKTAKIIEASNTQSDTREYKVKISYEQDEESLIPTVQPPKIKSPQVSKFVKVEPAQAKKIRISGNRKKVTAFKSEGLPEVALSGKLRVSTYEKEEDSTETPLETPLETPQDQHKVPEKIVVPLAVPTQKVTKAPLPLKTTFAPKSVVTTSSKTTSMPVLLSPLISTVIAALVSLAIFSASSQATVSPEHNSSGVTLQTANLLEIINR